MRPITKLGKFLKEEREKRNWSLRDFDKKSGLSYAYLSQLEKGYDKKSVEIIPSISTMSKIAKALNISLDELIVIAGYNENSNEENKDINVQLKELKKLVRDNELLTLEGEKFNLSDDDRLKIMAKIDECINVSNMLKKRTK